MSSVEIISTETMRPASLARQKSVQFQQNMETPKAQAGGVIFNLISGIALPMYAAIVYSSYGDRPCDKPVAGWLYTYALLGFITGGAGLYINVQKLRIGPALQAAQALQDENAKAEAMAPYVGAIATMGCLGCCVLFPCGVFSLFWWIKGNFDVWGTYPRLDISPTESILTFEGCDADLLAGARLIYYVSYVLITCTLLFCGCMCAAVLDKVVEAAVVEQRVQQQGRSAPRSMV